MSLAGEIDTAVGGKHIDAFDDTRIAYMRGRAGNKPADLVGTFTAERTFELRRKPAAEPRSLRFPQRLHRLSLAFAAHIP